VTSTELEKGAWYVSKRDPSEKRQIVSVKNGWVEYRNGLNDEQCEVWKFLLWAKERIE